MDRNRFMVLSMLVRRLHNGDKAQYMESYAEARDVTVGEYLEWMGDEAQRMSNILRSGIPAGVGVDFVGGGPSMLPSLLSAAVSPVAAPAAEIVEMVDRLDMARYNIAAQLGIPSHLLGRSDK